MDIASIDKDAFWSKCEPSPTCWRWTAAQTADGYGQFGVGKGRVVGAHRVSWALTNGPIPAGMNVLHRCDNPPCIRPDHLFLGTNADNSADMVRKHRGRRGAGTLRERSPRSWEIRVSAGRDPLTGKYRAVTKTIRGTRKQAQAALTALQSEVDEGRHSGTSGSLALLIGQWLDMVRPRLSPTTVDGYESIIRVHITPALGHVRVCDLRPAMLDNFYVALTQPPRNLAPSTVRQIHAVIRQACMQGVRWEWLPSNPASLASPPSPQPAEHHPPTPVDVLRLIDAATAWQPEMGVYLRLAAATGARRGELCALRWRHIDLDGGVVTIERAIIETGPGKSVWTEKSTKTGNRRKVSLDPDTLDVLRAHRAWWDATAAAMGTTIGPASYAFSREADGSEPWRPSGVTQAIRRLRDRLGLAGLRGHDLRHMHATQLLADGVPIKTVSGRLGHTLASTTLNIYAHALEAADQDAATSIGRTLARPAPPPPE